MGKENKLNSKIVADIDEVFNEDERLMSVGVINN